jgi:predicted  nucleic acid-binding Zn-ribbon protein
MTETLNEVVDTPIETPEVDAVADNVVDQTDETPNDNQEEAVNSAEDPENLGDKTEWPDKFENAYSRKKKQVNKLRAELEQVRAKIAEIENTKPDVKSVNPDDFETMEEYLKATMDALVKTQLQQTDTEKQRTQLTQEQEALIEQRNQYIAMQAQETAKSIPDFQQVVGQHTQVLDSLPEVVTNIFHDIDNAPLAAYVLAKEGRLESLRYANPYVAANMIISAEQRGVQLLGRKPQQNYAPAPEPMKGSKGQLKTTKNLMEGSVLRNLGLKS